jgi:hypothetical protein
MEDKKNYTVTSSIFVGCMFVGMGVGAYLKQSGIGTLIGMGVGFIAAAIMESVKKK